MVDDENVFLIFSLRSLDVREFCVFVSETGEGEDRRKHKQLPLEDPSDLEEASKLSAGSLCLE